MLNTQDLTVYFIKNLRNEVCRINVSNLDYAL